MTQNKKEHSALLLASPALAGNSTPTLNRAVTLARSCDFTLYHSASDGAWSKRLGNRIRGERCGNRQLAAQLLCGKFQSATAIAPDVEMRLRTSRFLGLVVSMRMLEEDWPALEPLIQRLSDLELASVRIVTILKENVTIPFRLRLEEWVDFRESLHFEESARELLTLLRENPGLPGRNPRVSIGAASKSAIEPAWEAKPLFTRARKATERIISNLFPVVEIPKRVFSVESRFHSETEIMEACGGPGQLPFVLKDARIYTVLPLTKNSVFAPALKQSSEPFWEPFTEWLSDPQAARFAIELLNRLLRHHAWKRGLRFEESLNLFYFTRSKPKNIWWEIGGRTVQRQVTAPHITWNRTGDHETTQFQCGWRHEAVRCEFTEILGSLFLRLEPAWFRTELDGKTPSTRQPVGPLDFCPPTSRKNGRILQTLRFWSAVLAKGHRELRIDVGTNPIRVRLVPAASSSPTVSLNDQIGFDTLALPDIDEAQLIPELGSIEE
jgi:hypothetical protein